MKLKMVHYNFNVKDMAASVEFYEKAVGLTVQRTKEASDGSFMLSFLGNDTTPFLLELTWVRDHPEGYNLGENEFHLAFEAEDYEAAHALHKEMGCICYENPAMGIYFINDPDGYWLEIVPTKI